MIHESVIETAGTYVGYWSKMLEGYPRYRLDSSLPSIGTVQLTLAHLIGKKQLSEEDKNLIAGAAAYIGAVAYQCWSEFSEDIKVELSCAKDDKREITISASGGKLFKSYDKFSVPITATLTTLLTSPPARLNAYEKHFQEIFPLPFLISSFAIGLFTGLTPFGAGPWRELTEADAKVQLLASDFTLSRSCALYYADNFPAEPFGGVPQFYSTGVILPPVGIREKYLGSRAAYTLFSHLIEEKVDDGQKRSLALNLLQSPHPALAAAGFCISVAMIDEQAPSERLLALCDSMGELRLALKGGVAMVRKLRGLPDSLNILLEQNRLDEAEKMIEAESAVGLLPLSRVPLREIVQIPKLVIRLYWLTFDSARAALDDYSHRNALSGAAILQGASIDLYQGNVARAGAELKDSRNKAELDVLTNPVLLSLRDEIEASVALAGENLDLATELFQRAASYTDISEQIRARMLYSYARCLLFKRKPETALPELEKSVELFPLFSAQLELIRLRAVLRPDENLDERIKHFVLRAPRAPEAFALLLANRAIGDRSTI